MKKNVMSLIITGVLAATTVVGCAVTREQSTVGEYVDDATITTQVKAKFADDPTVSAMAISVETLRGTVQLSGFAKSAAERSQAEAIASRVKGVKAIKNDIVVRR
ncbi:MAG TPA: BON domain-containing protein [Rhodocyclaceae bacterium]|nr:BON domain-containing protein [Rhodocyclaceae bacterium]